MNKSKRSQQQYATAWIGQTTLDAFTSTSGLSKPPIINSNIDTATSDSDLDLVSDVAMDPDPKLIPQTRQLSQHDTSDSEKSDSDNQSSVESPKIATQPPSSVAVSDNKNMDSDEVGEEVDVDMGHGIDEEDAAEEWEHELDETVQCLPAEIKDWTVLRTQIKQNLKKQSKLLTLSVINQLMILSNFATLRLKGILWNIHSK